MSARNLPIPYWLTILIGLGVGLLFALKTYLMYLYWDEMQYYVFERHALVPIVNYTLWGFLLPLAYFFISRFKVGRRSSWRENAMAIAGSLLMAFVHESLSNIIYYVPMSFLDRLPFEGEILPRILRSFPSAMVDRLIEYWILYAVVSGITYQRKFQEKQLELAQLESQLSGAQLNALKLQLQPHFLFNTLNTISSLMEIDVKDAQKIVSKLGTLLRSVLDKNKRNEVELRDELAFVQSYLDIEQVRFQDRLQILYHIREAALRCMVPSLILQPLVENAVKHGFTNQTGDAVIRLSAFTRDQRLHLAVEDDGQGAVLDREKLLSSGTGLQNVRDRLDLLYKNAYDLSIETAPGEGFAVHLQLPCKHKAAP